MPNNIVRLSPTNRDRDAVAIGELYHAAEQSIIQTATNWLACGHRLKEKRGDIPRGQWLPWLETNKDLLGFSQWKADRLMVMARKFVSGQQFDENKAKAFVAELWGHEDEPTRRQRRERREHAEADIDYLTLEAWNQLSQTERRAALETVGRAKLNKQDNESIGWAKWSWNPITGCLHNCPYCYARDIAERWYEQGFVPTLHPTRLTAPQNTTIPASDDVAAHNIFTGSMADMFGRWVPEPWIDAVMASVQRSPDLNFLFLTKFPKRMIDRDVPNNVWLGSTVDKQSRVKTVEDAFVQVPAHTRWLSLEPLLEPLQFSRPELFKWVVIGGASASSQTPAWSPPFRWVIDLYRQFKEAGAAVYFKTNIGFDGETAPREFPWQPTSEQRLPSEFNYRGNQ